LPSEVQGIVITEIEPGSAAEREGLRAGDVIEEVNRKPVRNLSDATATLRKQEGSVLLRVWSGGSSRYVVIDTAPQPKTREAPTRRRR
jgi:serine protease Do